MEWWWWLELWRASAAINSVDLPLNKRGNSAVLRVVVDLKHLQVNVICSMLGFFDDLASLIYSGSY